MLLATCSASAALVATPPLGTPMPYWTPVSPYCSESSRLFRGMPAYRFEQRSGPVLVDGQTSPLLDCGALHWVLLLGVSGHSQLCRNLRQRLFETVVGIVGHTAARRALASGRARARLYIVSDLADTRQVYGRAGDVEAEGTA
jgi:hypothetical protein